ncbi:MAG: hypothetical protein CTY16_11700 [Methylobacter sp.]|nr:MAG: hypothetical protein CTY16_11700 [Methylobacter sp.]
MDKQNQFTTAFRLAGLAAMALLPTGCAERSYSVLASTGTVIGVEVSQNPATQMPQGKLGYNRAELAFVPTNRNGGKDSTGSVGNGAGDTANVLMELRYGGIFDLGESSGIYQRLAVGDIAVQQEGAAVMFAKNADGTADPEAVQALTAIKSIPALDLVLAQKKQPMSKKYNQYKAMKDSLAIQKYDKAARSVDPGYTTYGKFAIDRNTSAGQIKAVCAVLKAQGEDLVCD